MDYQFKAIEQKWQQYWADNKTYKVENESTKPKYYILDMFPYPSGAGLHVGHPLGYIASDIVSRYKRLKGFNVLHPMGYDAFGLPAEQYAIQTGQHPATTTAANLVMYRKQLDNMGFSYDWDREIRTCEPDYYRWTQWIFAELFESWYNTSTNKAENISTLITLFESTGNSTVKAACDDDIAIFSATEWKNFGEAEQQKILLQYRLAFLSETMVNWCPKLGTVLSNDEVKDGLSLRGGHPVERKLMNQWSLRITAYAQRLLDDVEALDWPEAVKEMQRHWIGRSEGASMRFSVVDSTHQIEVFTTRPDTIFGCSFLVLAPEHELVMDLTTPVQKAEVEAYIAEVKTRSEVDRMANVKTVSGAFTGSYVLNPFTQTPIPVYITDYVLAGYGTGAVMAVPGGDNRDFLFAQKFNLPIPTVVLANNEAERTECYPGKDGVMINSSYLDGMDCRAAIKRVISEIEKMSIGKGKILYRMRDAGFSRQRYWGEPFPIYYKENIPYLIPTSEYPVLLPSVDKYLPTETGEPPLARAKDFTYNGYPIETNTMPGWAGSSWYFFRYMDAHNTKAIASKESLNYWQNVDLYLGGSEHATGHLLYCRFWTKFLFDKGLLPVNEPAQKLINQGMILGRSNFVYRINGSNTFVSHGLKHLHATTALHVDVNIVNNDVLDTAAFKAWQADYATAEFILEDDRYICGSEVEKMSKSKWNVVNPDDVITRYGADTLRMYEMFLGPLEQAKPWNTNGIEGVFKFLRKFWKLYHNEADVFTISTDAATEAELKVLHKLIKKVEEDIQRFSFNTSVSSFMIAVNELQTLKCNKKEILEPMALLLSSFAPHIAEELWQLMGNNQSITLAEYPTLNEKYLSDDSFEYPISINGKVKIKVNYSLSLDEKALEAEILANEGVTKFFEGKAPKKIIVVKGRIVNVVL